MDTDLISLGRSTIRQEAEALAGLVDSIDESFVRACELLFNCSGTVVVCGMGKSGLVARKWASTFSGTGTTAYFLNPSEALHGDLGVIRSGDVIVLLSLSGESDELSYVLRHAREHDALSIGVTANRESSLARQTTVLLSVFPSKEACPLGLAPTTSTTLMMALGDALAVALMKMHGFTERDFARLHPGGTLGRKLWLRVSELMHQGDAIPKVNPDDSLESVLLEMTRKCLGLAIVMEGEKFFGIITDGDLRRFFQKKSKGMTAKAAEIMTVHPKSIGPDALAVEARERMEQYSIHQLLIVDSAGKLLGVVHLHDLLRAKVV